MKPILVALGVVSRLVTFIIQIIVKVRDYFKSRTSSASAEAVIGTFTITQESPEKKDG